MEDLVSRRSCGLITPSPNGDWSPWIPANISYSSLYNFSFNLIGIFIASPNNETNRGLYNAIIEGGSKNISDALYETFPKNRFWTTYVIFLSFLFSLFTLTAGKFLYYKYWNTSGLKVSGRSLRLVTRLCLLAIAYTCLLWSAYMYKSSLSDREDNQAINFNNTKQTIQRMDIYSNSNSECVLQTAGISKMSIEKMFSDFQDGLLSECTGINSIPLYNFTYLQSHLNSTLYKSRSLLDQIQELKGFVITVDKAVLNEFSSYQMMFEDIVSDLEKYIAEVERVRFSLESTSDQVKRSYNSNYGNMQNWMVLNNAETLLEDLQKNILRFTSISNGVIRWEKEVLDFLRHYTDRFEHKHLDDVNNGFFVAFLVFLGLLFGVAVNSARGIPAHVGIIFFGIFMIYFINNVTNIVPHANVQRSVCEAIAKSPSYKNESNFFHQPAFSDYFKTKIVDDKTKKEESLKIGYTFSEVMEILMTIEGEENKIFAMDLSTDHFNKTIEVWKSGMSKFLTNFVPVNLTKIDQQTYHRVRQSFETLYLAGNETGYMPNFSRQYKIGKLIVRDIEILMKEVLSVEWSLVAKGNKRLKRDVITRCKKSEDYAEGIEKIGQDIVARTMKAYELIQKRFQDQDLAALLKDNNKIFCEAQAGPSAASLYFAVLMLLFWSLCMLILLKTALDWDYLDGHSQAPISTADPHSAPLVDKIEESIYHNPIAEI